MDSPLFLLAGWLGHLATANNCPDRIGSSFKLSLCDRTKEAEAAVKTACLAVSVGFVNGDTV